MSSSRANCPATRSSASPPSTTSRSGRATCRPRATRCSRGVADAEGLLSLLVDRVDAELIDAAPKLRAVANYAIGFDNIDVEAATARGIQVGNTPDVLTDATADLAWALMLAVARRIVEAHRDVVDGDGARGSRRAGSASTSTAPPSPWSAPGASAARWPSAPRASRWRC